MYDEEMIRIVERNTDIEFEGNYKNMLYKKEFECPDCMATLMIQSDTELPADIEIKFVSHYN